MCGERPRRPSSAERAQSEAAGPLRQVRSYHVAFFAAFDIPAFEELTYDYGYGPAGSVAGKRLICRCGAPTCRGRLL